MKFVWIPEAPEHPGLYASEAPSEGEAPAQPSTMNPHLAKQFDQQADCQAWCDANPVPKFVPKEHGFEEASDRATEVFNREVGPKQ